MGYLLYVYTFTNYGFGMMMSHHYGYQNNYPSAMHYLNRTLIVVAYIVIIISAIMLISMKTDKKNHAMTILNERLSRGSVSIEEYKEIKKTINNY